MLDETTLKAEGAEGAEEPQSFDMEALITDILMRHNALRSDFESLRSHFKEIQTYVRPFFGEHLSGTSANEDTENQASRMDEILDNTADRAADVMAAGIMGGIASPSRPWFKLSLSGDMATQDDAANEWIYEVEQLMYSVLAKSNLYSALYQAFDELGAGTACVGLFPDDKKVIRARAYTAGEYFLGLNANFEVDTVYREVWMTSRQLVQAFGEDKVSQPVAEANRNGGSEKRWLVIHAVEPNQNATEEYPKKEAFPYISVFLEYGGTATGTQHSAVSGAKTVLDLQGLQRFPYLTPRWHIRGGKSYGIGPYMRVLSDTKQLQAETALKTEALEKEVDPPVTVRGTPNDLQVNTFKGGITYDTGYAQGGDGSIRPLYEVRSNLQAIMMDIQDLRAQIKEGLFSDLFMMLGSMPYDVRMTATEVAERRSEKLQRLGPMLENTHTELLSPLIEEVYAMMEEAGMLPEPPESLQGQDLKIDYISTLAQAQQMTGITAIEQFSAFVGSIAGAKPAALDKLDEDEAINKYAERVGIPPSILRGDDAVAALRESRAKQQAQASAREANAQVAGTAQTLADTNVTSDSALSALLGSIPPTE